MGTLSEQDRLAVAAAYAAASRANDAAAMLALNASDAVTWHNFDEQHASPQQTVRAMGWIHRTVPDITWTDIAVLATESGFVWQSLLQGTAPGGPLRVHSCVIATLKPDGTIARIEEYLDSAATVVLRG